MLSFANKTKGLFLAALLTATGCGDMELDDQDLLTPEDEADLYEPYVDAVEQTLDGKALHGGKKEKGYAPVGYLMFANGGYCTATLVKKDVAITAAHCLTEKQADDVTFHLGKTVKKSKIKSKAEKLVIHPMHPTTKQEFVHAYDVGLVYLKKKIKKVKVATLKDLTSPPTDCKFRSVGYGGKEGKFSAGRRSTKVCMDPRTGPIQNGKSMDGYSCPGDSGSPIFRDKTLEIVAIVNGDYNHPSSDQPDLHCKPTSNFVSMYPLDLDVSFLSGLTK